jgi:hypothetical protein
MKLVLAQLSMLIRTPMLTFLKLTPISKLMLVKMGLGKKGGIMENRYVGLDLT